MIKNVLVAAFLGFALLLTACEDEKNKDSAVQPDPIDVGQIHSIIYRGSTIPIYTEMVFVLSDRVWVSVEDSGFATVRMYKDYDYNEMHALLTLLTHADYSCVSNAIDAGVGRPQAASVSSSYESGPTLYLNDGRACETVITSAIKESLSTIFADVQATGSEDNLVGIPPHEDEPQ